MGPAIEISGGSGANTIAGVASFGARAAFVGKVKDDTLGKAFTHDIRATGVTFTTPPASDGPSTARCYVLVTPDGERTMNTYLGAAQNLHARRPRREADRVGRHHLSRRLSVGPAAGQGGLPQGRGNRAWRRPQGRADAVGRVLRRPLSRRIPQSDAHRRGRPDLRQRERTEEPLSNRRFRYRRRGTARRREARRGDAQREGLRGRLARERTSPCRRRRSRSSSMRPARAICSRPDFSTGLARGQDHRNCARLGAIAAAEVIQHLGARPGNLAQGPRGGERLHYMRSFPPLT